MRADDVTDDGSAQLIADVGGDAISQLNALAVERVEPTAASAAPRATHGDAARQYVVHASGATRRLEWRRRQPRDASSATPDDAAAGDHVDDDAAADIVVAVVGDQLRAPVVSDVVGAHRRTGRPAP